MPNKKIIACFTPRRKGRTYRGWFWDEQGILTFVSYRAIRESIQETWLNVWLEFDDNIKELDLPLWDIHFYETEILKVLRIIT